MKTKILKYLSEFILIVVSISVSFWLNERSIANIEQQESRKVLENIEMEIGDLKKYCFERAETWNEDIILYSAFLATDLDLDRIKELTTSKSRIEYNLIYYRAFEPPMNRYHSIINSGDIKLIKSGKPNETIHKHVICN